MMEMGVEVTTPARRRTGVAMEFPASGGILSSSPPTMPPRLRRRLSESKTSPPSVEEIQAKLRDADLRRQKFYEHLSSKARPKPRSPSQSSSQEEDLGQRLEAKLQAAEQKRLSILAKAQTRLAKLDELRQSARHGVEMQFRKKRAELGTKVESRFQQAEANRLLILKACRQRRALLKERTSQSLLRRMARESKYKEKVRAAIYQKRAAAENKRLGLLEAEKRRAHARVLQVRKVANSISHQREAERKEMRNKLESRLQRARRQRAEYLMHRGRSLSCIHGSLNKMHEQADLLCRRLTRCWRQFLKLNKTTFDLAKAYDDLKINASSVKSMPFEQLAVLIESPAALRTTKALLDRVETRYKLSRAVSATHSSSSWDDIDHLLKRVASPKRRATPQKTIPRKEAKTTEGLRLNAKTPAKLARYQVRVILCAYMILGHPDAVLSGHGEREITLADSAEKFVKEFELLTKIILGCATESSFQESSNPLPIRTFRSQLAAFDSAWCSYLNSFVMWKVKDARLLEEDLVKAACQLELSMIQTCKMTQNGDSVTLTHDMRAIQKQVLEDHKILRERVHHLSGDAGIERMESALADTRSKYFQARDNGGSVGSTVAHIFSPSPTTCPDSPSMGGPGEGSDLIDGSRQSNRVVRSLFKDEPSSKNMGASAACTTVHPSSSSQMLDMENEFIVNESVHGRTFTDLLSFAHNFENGIKEKVRKTMEKAFWDGLTENMKHDEPNYDIVVELMREVRDEISGIAPYSWKQEIIEAIDVDILAQVLKSGKLDMAFLGRILDFALVTLQKLSSPAAEEELKATHQKFLKEVAETCQSGDHSKNTNVIALIRGLRFVLEQIQGLKQEISKARIRLLGPLLKGPAATDFLRKAFANHYGPPSHATTALPLTMQWLSSVKGSKDDEWNEYMQSISELSSKRKSPSETCLPSGPLRTGGRFSAQTSGGRAASISSTASSSTECKGEEVDLLVRLGLLRLVNGISGLVHEGLPETLKLNIFRLRGVQARLQKITVIATSILVVRQILHIEQIVTNPADMEDAVLSCANQLSALVESNGDAGLEEIITVLGKILEGSGNGNDTVNLNAAKEIMARMLTKSLQAGDAVFARVSRAIYLASRGVVLAGSAAHGKELAETALRQIGAFMLTDDMVTAASELAVTANVSVNVHGPWYACLNENI